MPAATRAPSSNRHPTEIGLSEPRRAAFDSLARGGVNLTLWVIPEASHGLMLGVNNSAGYPAGLHERLAHWVAEAAGVQAR